jgi:hypothetical protein
MDIGPAEGIRIWDDDGYLKYSARKGSEADLVGDWLTSDIQGSSSHLVRLLDAIETLRTGRADKPYEANGNAWHVVITADQVEIENKYVDHRRGIVSINTVLAIMRSYWNALGEPWIENGKLEFREFEQREPRLPW